MNQVATPGTDPFLARYRGLRERLPGEHAARDGAAALFGTLGLPSTRDEAWHYTSLRSLGDTSFQEPLTEVSSAPVLGPLPDLPRLVMIDGRYQPGLSTLPDTVTVTTFGASPRFGTTGEKPRVEIKGGAMPMVAVNTMLAEDGVQLHVAAGTAAGSVVLLSLAPDGHRPIDFHPRHSITLEAGASLTVIEIARGEGTYLHNAVFDVTIAPDATLSHIRLQDEAADAVHVSTVVADIGDRATYDFFVLTLGARLSRAEVHAKLGGPGATVHLNGAQLLTGTQHGDITTVVNHAAPNCASNQTIKNVLNGRARGVFQGKIEVDRIAQKTDGYQMSQALLLSPTAEIDCKPQLEIYADDVKCSHGTTVGELDADQLFFLRSRGIPAAEARAILVRAFLTEAMDNINDTIARDMLEQAVESWWERHPA